MFYEQTGPESWPKAESQASASVRWRRRKGKELAHVQYSLNAIKMN